MPPETEDLAEEPFHSGSEPMDDEQFGDLQIGELTVEFELSDDTLGDVSHIATILDATVSAIFQTEGISKNSRAELFVRIVDAEESQALNAEFRSKDKPTNVLSFPGTEPATITNELAAAAAEGAMPVVLGDIIICAPVMIKEAQDQSKTRDDHLKHMIVHGVMHLLGYDHIAEDDAIHMETKETDILARLGVANPYKVDVKIDGETDNKNG